jgi:hypothetical protein
MAICLLYFNLSKWIKPDRTYAKHVLYHHLRDELWVNKQEGGKTKRCKRL